MISNIPLQAGDILRTVSPCGGGYGNPQERDPERVLADVRNGIVSVKSAQEQYGVAIQGNTIDQAATTNLRS